MKTESLLLDHYHCTFFLPLIDLPDNLKPERAAYLYPAGTTNETEAQTYHYFTPVLRDILFARCPVDDQSRHPRPLQEWHLDEAEIKKLKLYLGKETDKDDPLLFQKSVFESVILYRYFNGIYLLSFQVMPEVLQQLQQAQKALKEKKIAELIQTYKEDNNGNEPNEATQETITQKAGNWLTGENNGLPLFCNNAPATAEQALFQCPVECADYAQLQLEAWLRFTRLARLLYPSFAEQNQENKIAPLHLYQDEKKIATAFNQTTRKLCIPHQPGEKLSPVVRKLLSFFFTEEIHNKLNNNTSFYDDRLYVSVAYGLTEKKLPAKQLKRIFSLALYVDRHSDTWGELDDHVYTPDIIKPKVAQHSMQLWEGLGGHFGYTGYSNAALYSGEFFRDIIAPIHIPALYNRMLVQALFYQASLRYYDKEICNETDEILKENTLSKIRQQRKEFIRFTNQYWFHNLTEQLQGKEIFRLQQEALELQAHYDIIKDELERTDEYLHTEHEIRVSEISTLFTRWGLVIAFVALYYAALPMIFDYSKEMQGVSLWKLLEYQMVSLNVPQGAQSLLGAGLILLGIPCIITITVLGIKKMRGWIKT